MQNNKVSQIVVFGEVLFDCFPDGSRVLGGAPFNVAWHLQAFNVHPLFVSRVGNDEDGRNILAVMQKWGMSTEAVQTDLIHPTGKVSVRFADNEPHYEIVADSAYDFIDSAKLPVLPENCILYHGSLAFRQTVSFQCLSCLQQQKTLTKFVDVNLRSPWWNLNSVQNLVQDADWIKLNREELNTLSELADNFMTNDRMLLITHGPSGASLMRQQGEILQVTPEKETKVVDTVGAGDAFSSVMLLGILRDWPLTLCLQRAQEFASAVVGIRGAVSLDKAFYQRFIDIWQL